VLDGALIPGSTAACNPSITIAAIAERATDDILARDVGPVFRPAGPDVSDSNSKQLVLEVAVRSAQNRAAPLWCGSRRDVCVNVDRQPEEAS
jgi:hypothetical protein